MSATWPRYLVQELGDDLSFRLVLIEGGVFTFGEGSQTKGIRIPSYYLGEFPVIQELWARVMTGENPSTFLGQRRPVNGVSWNDTQDFLRRLNAMPEVDQRRFRLPSEAEWEYAALGGKLSKGLTYAGSNDLDEVGWCGENSYGETKPVGLKLPNELGLYDMSGNVWECCEDDWHDSLDGLPGDGSARIDFPERGWDRVLRGGSYFFDAGYCRVAYRYYEHPDSRFHISYGFRLAVSCKSVGEPGPSREQKRK